MFQVKVVDANVVLRHLLRDVEDLASEADRIFKDAALGKFRLFMPHAVVAEVVYVLTKGYRVPREKVSAVLKKMLKYQGLDVQDKDVVVKALELFASTKGLSFVDCMLCAFKLLRGMDLVSFDEKLVKKCR